MLLNDDTSSIRNDYTAWVTAHPTTVRARHMTDKGDAAPVFRAAFEKTCLSSPPESPAGLTGYWSKRGSAF